MKSQEKDAHLFEMALLWAGHIDYKKFINAYSKKLSEFPEIMAATKYNEIVQNGYKHYEKEENFMVLEKEIENYLIDSIKGAKLIAFGPEPLVAYFLAKKNNALIIRMIMINKLNNIEPEEIKNRLRKLYI
jgi:V/A-type H+-transporting ATPase subunit C